MKIIIVNYQAFFRNWLISIISNKTNINRIIEASTEEEAEFLIESENPNIAFVGLRLGYKKSGLSLIKKTKRTGVHTKFIILYTEMSANEFEEAEKIGIDGYIFKEFFTEDDITYAINLVSRGEKYYFPGVIEQYNYNHKKNNKLHLFTPREIDVVTYISKGFTNEEIAKQLFISLNTVKKHVSNILTKLNINNRAQLIYLANNNWLA